jgi:hypothetical protein
MSTGLPLALRRWAPGLGVMLLGLFCSSGVALAQQCPPDPDPGCDPDGSREVDCLTRQLGTWDPITCQCTLLGCDPYEEAHCYQIGGFWDSAACRCHAPCNPVAIRISDYEVSYCDWDCPDSFCFEIVTTVRTVVYQDYCQDGTRSGDPYSVESSSSYSLFCDDWNCCSGSNAAERAFPSSASGQAEMLSASSTTTSSTAPPEPGSPVLDGVIFPTLTDLVRRSHTVVAGWVVNNRSRLASAGGPLVTDYAIKVQEVLKGRLSNGDVLMMRRPAAEPMTSASLATAERLTVGRRYVLFLSPMGDSGNRYAVAPGYPTLFELDLDRGILRIRNHRSEDPIALKYADSSATVFLAAIRGVAASPRSTDSWP